MGKPGIQIWKFEDAPECWKNMSRFHDVKANYIIEAPKEVDGSFIIEALKEALDINIFYRIDLEDGSKLYITANAPYPTGQILCN